MTTFIEYLQYPFFFRALIAGGIMSLLLSWMSGYVVLRQQVLFTHALSNIGFLGIALAILFQVPITPMLIGSCLLAAYLIHFMQRKKLFDNDSLLGIFAQLGLALGIIVIAFFPGYRVNIEQFLFGDILGVNSFDFNISIILLICVGIGLIFWHNTFLKISLSDTLSHTLVQNKNRYHALLIFLLSIMIALAMKIIGVLLVAAFTTIPSNTAKLVTKNLRQTFILSSFLGLAATLVGLYLSIATDIPSGPLIVSTLGVFWVLAIAYDRWL